MFPSHATYTVRDRDSLAWAPDVLKRFYPRRPRPGVQPGLWLWGGGVWLNDSNPDLGSCGVQLIQLCSLYFLAGKILKQEE